MMAALLDTMMDDAATASKQCFAPIQSRRLWAPIVSTGCRLCPSMDLVVVTTAQSSSSRSMSLHRTESWQKLSSCTRDNDSDNQSTIHVAWSPHGRLMAVAWPDRTVCLHHVELILSTGSSNGNAAGDAGEFGRVHTIENNKHDEHSSILGMAWAHVGRPHSSWVLSDRELEQAETWRYRSKYVDRSSFFLPPSSYHLQQDKEEHEAAASASHPSRDEQEENATVCTLPTAKTPLGMLCVATSKGIRLYLHGRYHIATLPYDSSTSATGNVQMVCSSDLSHLLLTAKPNVIAESPSTISLSLYSLPALQKHRYHYQTIAALQSSIVCHVNAIRQHSKETIASFKSALKPLDMKLAVLVRLLKTYGIQDLTISQVLWMHLVMGHAPQSSDNSNVSNAVDQFFTNVQMNDQLLVRLERSMHGSVASVEAMARKGLLAPAQALVYATDELQQYDDKFDFCTELHQASEILLVTVTHMIALLVEVRFRLRDLISWLRSVGSEIKARGTAADAPQRENAKKRRVPQAVVSRMASYLQQRPEQRPSNSNINLTESLLGVPFSDFFSEETRSVVCERTLPSGSIFLEETKEPAPWETPTVNFCVSRVQEFADRVFEQPRETLSQSVSCTSIVLPTQLDGMKLSIHSRIGKDRRVDESYSGWGETETPKGLFQPRIVEGMYDEETYSSSRHWAIVASRGMWMGDDAVEIYCLALGGRVDDADDIYSDSDEENDSSDGPVSFYLTSRLVLPPNCRVKEIGFYGDNGKSSLSSGTDSGTGQEGRQAMGLLLDRGGDDAGPATLSEELWILPYDKLLFQPVSVDRDNRTGSIVLQSRAQENSTAHVQPIQDEHDDSMQEDDSVVHAKTRKLRTHSGDDSPHDAPTTRLLLSGSRGIGGVFTTANNMSTLELFDLEEEEEIEDSDEEEDEEL